MVQSNPTEVKTGGFFSCMVKAHKRKTRKTSKQRAG